MNPSGSCAPASAPTPLSRTGGSPFVVIAAVSAG
jgi:hypothetical protein